MNFCRVPPVRSPLNPAALTAGVRSAWLGGGADAREFVREALQRGYSPRALLLTDSGTSALTFALKAVRARTQAPVALPGYSCFDVATAAVGAGVDIVLYDLDPHTLSPDLESLRRCFEAGARSVVVAHLYGVPADLAAVQEQAAKFGAIVIEDAAQGSGCEWRGKPAGAHGGLGILSFGRGKGVTGGRGGALLINDESLVDVASAQWDSVGHSGLPRGSAREVVLLLAQWMFGRPGLYGIPASMPFLGLGDTIYRPPGPIGELSAVAAGVLTETLSLVPAEVAIRRANARRLQGQVVARAQVVPPAGWLSGWLRFPVLRSSDAAGELPRELLAEGVTRGYPSVLADLEPVRARARKEPVELRGARSLVERLVTLPTYLSVPNRPLQRLDSLVAG